MVMAATSGKAIRREATSKSTNQQRRQQNRRAATMRVAAYRRNSESEKHHRGISAALAIGMAKSGGIWRQRRNGVACQHVST